MSQVTDEQLHTLTDNASADTKATLLYKLASEVLRLRSAPSPLEPAAGESDANLTKACETCEHLGVTADGWCVDCDWRTNGIKVALAYRKILYPAAIDSQLAGKGDL